MSSYYYIDDPESDLGYFPVPEEEFIKVILSIAQQNGIKITDEMILKELEGNKKISKQSKKPRMINIRGK